jgi:hypothetical protein
MVLTGLLVHRYVPEANDISTLFALKEIGLPYSFILQIAGLSFILAVFSVLLCSEYFLARIRFLLRFFLFFLTTFFTISVFAIIFKWFPVGNLFVWIGYILSSIICFVIGYGITYIKFKLENKKYNMLLNNFKMRQKGN